MLQKFEIEKFESGEVQSQLRQYWVTVSDQIQLVNRLLFIEWVSSRVIAGWVPAAAEFEWKTQLTYYMWQNMTIAEKLRKRKEELAGNAKIVIPSQKLEELLQNVARADSFHAFMGGWFLEVQRDLVASYEHYLYVCDPIFDAPTIELLEEIIPKKRKQLEWAHKVIHNAVAVPETLSSVERWRSYTKKYLLYIGGLLEKEESLCTQPVAPAEPYGPAPEKRSMPDWLDTNVKLDEFPEEFAGTLKTFMWHYATEIQVIDPMCYVFYGMDDMPFEFFVDFSRHIWDEVRHHLMGVRRLEQMGYDPKKLPLPYDEKPVTELEQYYLHLTMLGETCSFSRKKKSMEAFYEKGDIISGMTAEIDIVDERSHVKFGKKWLEPMFSQRLGDHRTLEELIRGMIEGVMQELPEAERKSISHFAFCGRIEFKNLSYDRL
ncbi:hypothetical protein SY83_20245 [Paenibacillus swuensis]|uniref:DUF455 family protein n=1 Tax=Paenibacillus swuensis TaxID=1178515 RepID=A0A172TMD4_9BACL|nr:DUF455 family protein [Paenibacillus swuensis]ANE48235.1 hypothetical protein SY83_20245 [Paenibacillus swuensis]